jgi:hypothetical protein
MSQPSPLSVRSNALKIADEVTGEAVENKIRRNSQGWEDARIIGERQMIMVVAYKGQIRADRPDWPARGGLTGLKTSNV